MRNMVIFDANVILRYLLNDKAVMKAYGFPIKNFTESDCVAELMKMYHELTK